MSGMASRGFIAQLLRNGAGKPVLLDYNSLRQTCNGIFSMRFMMFSKHLQSLPLQTAAQKVRELGFEGLDLTVRPGGFVEPAQVQERLPEAIATCADAGLKIG